MKTSEVNTLSQKDFIKLLVELEIDSLKAFIGEDAQSLDIDLYGKDFNLNLQGYMYQTCKIYPSSYLEPEEVYYSDLQVNFVANLIDDENNEVKLNDTKTKWLHDYLIENVRYS